MTSINKYENHIKELCVKYGIVRIRKDHKQIFDEMGITGGQDGVLN